MNICCTKYSHRQKKLLIRNKMFNIATLLTTHDIKQRVILENGKQNIVRTYLTQFINFLNVA